LRNFIYAREHPGFWPARLHLGPPSPQRLPPSLGLYKDLAWPGILFLTTDFTDGTGWKNQILYPVLSGLIRGQKKAGGAKSGQ
jgi:hypothetical protein